MRTKAVAHDFTTDQMARLASDGTCLLTLRDADQIVPALLAAAAHALCVAPEALDARTLSEEGMRATRCVVVARARVPWGRWDAMAVRLGTTGLAVSAKVCRWRPLPTDRDAWFEAYVTPDSGRGLAWALVQIANLGERELARRIARGVHRVLSRRYPDAVADAVAYWRGLNFNPLVIGVAWHGQVAVVDLVDIGYTCGRSLACVLPGVGLLGTRMLAPVDDLRDPRLHVHPTIAAARVGLPVEAIKQAYAGTLSDAEIAAWRTLAALA